MENQKRQGEYKPPTEIVKQFLDDIVRNPRNPRIKDQVAWVLTGLTLAVKELKKRTDRPEVIYELSELIGAAYALVASLPDLDLSQMIKERELDDAAFDRLEEEEEEKRDRQATAD